MKKLGLFIDSVAEGGAFQYCESLLNVFYTLSKHNLSPVIYYTHSSWRKYLRKYKLKSVFIKPRNFQGSSIIYKSIKFLPTNLTRTILVKIDPAIKKMIGENCDLWIFPTRNEWMYLIKVNNLCVVHDLMHIYEKFPESRENGEYERREKISKNICIYSKGVIVDSEVGRKQFSECYEYPFEKIYPLPFIAPSYIYKTNANIKILKKFKLPKEYIFYPAQFWKHKNHQNLIKAIASLAKKIPDINLVLTGQKRFVYKEVKKLVKKLRIENKVFFLDYVDDQMMVIIYKKAKMLVMPTFYGPTNMPPIEAFALGCPVAVSQIYGMPEQLGNAALFFDPKSVKDITYCIKKLWTNDQLRKTLIKRGKIWTKKWGKKQFSQRLLEIVNANS